MKIRLFLVMGLSCLISAQTYALSFMGPPTAELIEGQYSLGYNYSYSIQDLDKTRRDFVIVNNGAVTSTGERQLRIEDLTVQRHYVGINCGFADWWEIYASIGFSDVKGDINRFDSGTNVGYNFDNDFAWGWGTKVTFNKSDAVAWGVSLHMNWLDTGTGKTDGVSGTGTWRDKVAIDTYDTLIAVGPTVDMGGWKLYGGPFYYSLDGDYNFERTFFELNSTEMEDAHIQEDSDFGAFIGAVVDLADNSDLTAEFSCTSDGWAIGTGIAQKF